MSSTQADVETLQAEIKKLREDFASLSETLRDVLRHGSTETIAKARESGERLWGEARKHARGLTDEIEEKPVIAALTAFGVGIVLGMLFSHRH